ncbi:MAG: GNAT family N-acetyltransferase, partial [Erythrobacter sp.]
AAMDELDYADMIEHTPVNSVVTEYRERLPSGKPGRLVGACLTDRQSDGLSMIYSFYDPDLPAGAGLGSFIILDHIRRAAAEGLPYVYLGYWVEGSPRMQYKVRYRPLERLTREGWQVMDPDEQHRLIAAATAPRQPQEASLAGARGKDGQPVKFPES